MSAWEGETGVASYDVVCDPPQLLVFEKLDGNGTTADIAVIPSNGTNQRVLTTHPRWDGDPAWSPDGTRLAFVRFRCIYGDYGCFDTLVISSIDSYPTVLYRPPARTRHGRPMVNTSCTAVSTAKSSRIDAGPPESASLERTGRLPSISSHRAGIPCGDKEVG